jgi:tRNA pseudouridine32 synthase / 23S rRNA pseudouridine746 synthase
MWCSKSGTAPLPVRNGLAPSYCWLPPGTWPDLLSFLLHRFPAIAPATWLARMARGEVVAANGTLMQPDSRYQSGLQIFYYRELEQETPIPFKEQILFQDAHLLVVDKPHFLPVTPTGRFVQECLLVRLRQQQDLPDLTPIHRLDRETAGVVIFSLQRASRGAYQALFRERAVQKVYEAVAPVRADWILPTGSFADSAIDSAIDSASTLPLTWRSRIEPANAADKPFFCMQEVAGEVNAETQIRMLYHNGKFALYQLHPLTGRTHQLRVHMAALGVPIVNDAFYPVAQPCKGDDVSQPLQLLARSITFVDPISGLERAFGSERQLAQKPV